MKEKRNFASEMASSMLLFNNILVKKIAFAWHKQCYRSIHFLKQEMAILM